MRKIMTEPQNVNITTDSKSVGRNKLFSYILPITIVVILVISCYLGCNFFINKIDTAAVKTEEIYAVTKQLQVKYEQLQDNLQNLQKELQKSKVTKIKYWKPMVIEHLVHLAVLTLNTTRDTTLALTFLAEAKQYASNHELSAINYALNRDIASLQIVPVVDATDLILKIEAINQKISSLPIVTSRFISPPKAEAVAEDELRIKTLWQRFFNSTIKALKDIVIIRHKEVDLLLSPEQEAVLRLEIKAKLLQAELAVMQRKNKIYQDCLVKTLDLCNRYFAASTNDVANFLVPSLQELQRVNLEPTIPLPTESIAAITNLINANKIFDDKQTMAEPMSSGAMLVQKEEGTPRV